MYRERSQRGPNDYISKCGSVDAFDDEASSRRLIVSSMGQGKQDCFELQRGIRWLRTQARTWVHVKGIVVIVL